MITLPQPWPNNPWPTTFRTVRQSPAAALPAGLQFITVQSPALRGRADVAVFVAPAIRDDAADLPIVVMLHGVYGSFWNWALNGRAHEVVSKLMAAGEIEPMVLVMPSDGMAGEGTAYLDHGDADYERWIIDDVPACVAEATPVASSRSPLALMGNSMGGFGALRLAAIHRDRVAAAVGHSPITNLADLAAFTVDDLADTLEIPASERSLATTISRKPDGLPPLLFDCGTSDPLIESNRALHHALAQSNVSHRYEEYDGAHDWPSWHGRLEIGLRFLDRAARNLESAVTAC